MNRPRLLLLLAFAALLAGFFALDLRRFLSLDFLQSQHAALLAFRDARPLACALLYAAAYIAVAALSLPFATVLSLAGGALFGLGEGVLLVSFAASLGASLAFLSARFLFREAVAARFGGRLAAIDAGLARDGWRYVFSIRLMPVLPFFLVNLALGLTRLPLWTFYWASQLGMLPLAAAYVNAGTELAKLQSPADIFSPGLLLSLGLAAALPWLARRLGGRG